MLIAGHRGFGCTDHNFYQTTRDIASLPVENTLESIETAFKAGAKYIETDALISTDGVFFTLHNVVPKDHFFGDQKPHDLLNKMTFSDIQKHKTGHNENGTVAKLEDVIALAQRYSSTDSPFDINIEIKGVQGSGQPHEQNDYLEKLANLVKESNIPAERVLFSSFCLENIVRMSHLSPGCTYGMLFCERKEEPSPIYLDHTDDLSYQYTPFNKHYINNVLSIWESNAESNTALEYLNPETATITEDEIQYAAENGLGINSWGLFEELTEEKKQTYKTISALCHTHQVFLSCITDYCDEMIELAKTMPTTTLKI